MQQRDINYTSFAVENQSLSTAWGDLIGKFAPFGWFLTATFTTDVTEDFAVRQYRKWIRKINAALFGRRYIEKGLCITHVWGIERTKKGRVHLHCLLDMYVVEGSEYNGYKPLHRKTWEKIWESQSLSTNGFMRIYPVVELGARYYVGKYASKGGKVDFWLRPSLYRKRPLPLSLSGSTSYPE